MDLRELDISGADAVVIQAVGEAADGMRLWVGSVSPTPRGHIS